MKKPIYIRDGSRFRRIEDYVGMFWDESGRFTETKKDNSIGIVVSQDSNELTIASLKLSIFRYKWNEAIKHCSSFSFDLLKVHCYLPTRSELLSAVDNFGEYLYTNNQREWTSTERSLSFAWAFYWCLSGSFNVRDKDENYYVRKFFKVEV